MRYLLFVVFVCFMVFGATSKQLLDLASDDSGEAFISLDDLTRFKTIDDRIKLVYANAGEIEVRDDVVLGEVYIRLIRSSMSPITIFVATEKGRTYKMLLVPQKIPAEQVFIRHKEVYGGAEDMDAHRVKGIRAIATQMIEGMEYTGSCGEVEESNKAEEVFIDTNLKIVLQYRCRSGFLIGETLEIHNIGSKKLVMEPKVISRQRDIHLVAMSPSKEEIEPGSSLTVHIVRRGDNE